MVSGLTVLLLQLVLGLALADYTPQFHHIPTYRYGALGSAGDTAGSVYSAGRYHVFSLSHGGVQHSSTEDLVHWVEHGVVGNLDDSGGITIDPNDGTAVALSAGGLIAKVSTSADQNLSAWSALETIFHTSDSRSPAMAFPGDPLAPWQDPRDGWWYTALAIDGCNQQSRQPELDYACPAGGFEELWRSKELRGAEWVKVGSLLQANHTAPSTGAIPQVTEFVTPDWFAPGSVPGCPTNDTAVFMSSVYGPRPCCLHPEIPRWNFQQYLVGRQHIPGAQFSVDWSRSGAVDYGGFTPNAQGGLDVTTSLYYSCCGKSAFTPEGRRVLLHTTLQNGGPNGNSSENAFALARDVYFDAGGRLRQRFVPELARLRRERHKFSFNLTEASGGAVGRACAPPRSAGVQCLLLPVIGTQTEIVATVRRAGLPVPGSSWGLEVFASQDLTEATQVGFEYLSSNKGRTFVDRTRAKGNPAAARDVRAGPLPSSDSEQLHLFIDHSIVSLIASEEVALTVWSHPAQQSSAAIAVFAAGAPAQVDVEFWSVAALGNNNERS